MARVPLDWALPYCAACPTKPVFLLRDFPSSLAKMRQPRPSTCQSSCLLSVAGVGAAGRGRGAPAFRRDEDERQQLALAHTVPDGAAHRSVAMTPVNVVWRTDSQAISPHRDMRGAFTAGGRGTARRCACPGRWSSLGRGSRAPTSTTPGRCGCRRSPSSTWPEGAARQCHTPHVDPADVMRTANLIAAATPSAFHYTHLRVA